MLSLYLLLTQDWHYFLVRIAPHWLSLVVQLPWQWLKFLQSTAKENKIEWYNRTYSVPTKDGSSKSFIYHHTQWCGLPWLTSDIPDDLKNDLMLSETSSAQNAISVAEHSRMVRLLRRDHMGTLCWCPVIGGKSCKLRTLDLHELDIYIKINFKKMNSYTF